MAHLASAAVFSPSLARQQLAVAKDWNYVDSWLSTKFKGKALPPFERNNDTLKTLLALAALNETADEERELLVRVQAKALEELDLQEESDLNHALLGSLEQSLTREGAASLDTLGNLCVFLTCPLPDTEKLGQRILDLQVKTSELEQTSDRIIVLERYLSEELDQINNLIEEIQGDAYQPSADSIKQTIDMQRRTKTLAAKLPELKDRAASLTQSVGNSKLTIHNVRAEEDEYREILASVKELEAQVKTYHGLPQDTDLARLELEQLRVELRDLIRRRDNMFEGLVERESPQKAR